MEKLNINILQAFIILFTISVFFSSCNDDSISEHNQVNNFESKLQSNGISNNYSFNDYLVQASNELDISFDFIESEDLYFLENENEVVDYLLNLVNDNRAVRIDYFDVDFYLNNFEGSSQGIDISQLEGLDISERTLEYFNDLSYYYKTSNFQAIVDLKNDFVREFDSNSDMISLATTFAVIEYFESDLLSSVTTFGAECAPSGTGVAKSAIGGAILGARIGFMFGSFLGPAGTAAATVGGAIAGGIYAAILSVGIQGVSCELGWD